MNIPCIADIQSATARDYGPALSVVDIATQSGPATLILPDMIAAQQVADAINNAALRKAADQTMKVAAE